MRIARAVLAMLVGIGCGSPSGATVRPEMPSSIFEGAQRCGDRVVREFRQFREEAASESAVPLAAVSAAGWAGLVAEYPGSEVAAIEMLWVNRLSCEVRRSAVVNVVGMGAVATIEGDPILAAYGLGSTDLVDIRDASVGRRGIAALLDDYRVNKCVLRGQRVGVWSESVGEVAAGTPQGSAPALYSRVSGRLFGPFVEEPEEVARTSSFSLYSAMLSERSGAVVLAVYDSQTNTHRWVATTEWCLTGTPAWTVMHELFAGRLGQGWIVVDPRVPRVALIRELDGRRVPQDEAIDLAMREWSSGRLGDRPLVRGRGGGG